ncbi:MAG: right-handed parallel beta-helix repeat-containing protein [Verrucomicrobia bacterium]|nr:right-handed parallel beta-helix repeat-containing protein [Verrucomicrobiota bacterium]
MSRQSATFLLRRPWAFCLVAVFLVGSFAAALAWSKPPTDSDRNPDQAGNVRAGEGNVGPKERSTKAVAAPRVVPVTKVEPNARSKALAEAEAVAAGLPATSAGDLPSSVDHSTSIHFPPIMRQLAGDCSCYSSTYYYLTFMQAQDEDLDASTLDPTKDYPDVDRDGGAAYDEVICSPRFTFVLISEASGFGATGTRTAMERLSTSGAPFVTEFDYNEDMIDWPSEEAWVAALRNRPGQMYSIRLDLPDHEGIEAAKQALANGSCLVTRGDFGANHWDYLVSASGYGINNRVMYDRDMGGHGLTHSFCIVGYDDNKSYYDHRDGKTHYGAFIVSDSEGWYWDYPYSWFEWYNSTGTGTKGFMWIAYTMFEERQLGYYNWVPPMYTGDPCNDNEADPTAYYHDDRPNYRPKLFAVVGVNHSKRNMLILDGGIGTNPLSPDFQGPEAIKQTDYGQVAINDSRRVAVDLTDGVDLLEPGLAKQVYVRLRVVSGAGSSGTITSADFYYDPEGDGSYMVFSSADPTVWVSPGGSGCATVQITAPETIYVDDDAVGNPVQDGTAAHPYETIQAGINAATGPAVVKVLPGMYHESVEMASNITLLGSGADRTFIDSAGQTNSGGLGEAVFCSGIVGATVDGFSLTTSDTSNTAVRTINSTVTVQNCVATGCGSGFGAGQTGGARFVNCLAYGNNRGIWQSGTCSVVVRACTLVDNSDVGLARWGTGTVTLTDSILWDNGDDLSASSITVSYCNIGDGDFAGTNGNISQDPLFVAGQQHGYYLSQTAAGQGADSPCVDACRMSARYHDLSHATTRTDGGGDGGLFDMGYHTPQLIEITSICAASPDVLIEWNARADVNYVVEWSDNRVDWYEVPVGATSTWLDTNAASYVQKYYRVREE